MKATKPILLHRFMEKTGLPYEEAEWLMEQLLSKMNEQIITGGAISFRGMGRWRVTHRAPYVWKRKDKPVTYVRGMKRIQFTPSQQWINSLFV